MASHYLDLETGELIMITDEARREWNDLYALAEVQDPEAEPDLEALIAQAGLQGWQADLVRDADRVEAGFGERYVEVRREGSREGYRDMEDFIETVADARLGNRLARAIEGRGAFRRFKDVLEGDPAERERWFAFKDDREEQRAVEWLAAHGVEPLPVEPSPEEAPGDPSPPLRSLLLDEVLAFVRAAAALPGVLRVALIGSLATDKPEPHDVDMLVTVADEADLAPLATLGRKLNGHCMAVGAGGEVFLADPRGRHLGRTCPWKECRPGVRMSCDALHCGRRPYLHDDLQVIRLAEDLVRAPPIELWPRVVARVPVPEDVKGGLLGPLADSLLR